MQEEWRDVKTFEGLYEVSSEGGVRSLLTLYAGKPRLLVQTLNKKRGYLAVGLCINGIAYTKTVHRLVAEAFIPNPDNKPEVAHKDNDKQRNVATNLYWATYSENLQQTYDEGRARKVSQYSLDGMLLQTYFNCAEAEHITGLHRQSIARCARGERLSYAGYLWKYLG